MYRGYSRPDYFFHFVFVLKMKISLRIIGPWCKLRMSELVSRQREISMYLRTLIRLAQLDHVGRIERLDVVADAARFAENEHGQLLDNVHADAEQIVLAHPVLGRLWCGGGEGEGGGEEGDAKHAASGNRPMKSD